MAISLAASANQGVTEIRRNKFYNLQNSTTSTLRVINGTPGTNSTLNIVNNFFSLTLDNGTKTSIYAIQLSGSTEYTTNIYYNSFRLGGTHTGGTAGNIISASIVKSSTGATAVFNTKNNISLNERTGGTAGTFHTNFFAGTANTVGTLDVDYNTWFANGGDGAFHNGWAGFVYNDITQYKAAASPHEQNANFKYVHFVSNTDLHLADSSWSDWDLAAIPLAGITIDIDGDLRDIENPYRGADEAPEPIPVELTSFTANVSNNIVTLEWSTATETNNRGFSVERKSEENNFAEIGFVDGKGTTTEITNYSFTDSKLKSGVYTYRLKQIDFDGTTAYSNEIEVDVAIPDVFSLEQNYPNPFNPATIIQYSLPVDGSVKLTVFNSLGEKVAELVNEIQKAGVYEVSFNASRFASGVYFYRLESADFVSIKKMMLIK
jgi:hypothetical protein